MKKDFNFEDIGKRTPYLTPEGFFQRMQEEVMERTLKKKSKKVLRLKLAFAAVIGAAAMLTGILFFSSRQLKTENRPSDSFIVATGNGISYSDAIDQYVENMSDEELAEWIEFSENDIFMNLN